MDKQAMRKGDIRNTVLRQIKVLEKTRHLLDEGREIKEDETEEFKKTNPTKARKLKTQIKIITQGLRQLGDALKSLEKYKGTSTKTASEGPSFFECTHYRLPTKKEVIEKQKNMLIKCAEMLCDMFPDNETYKKLLGYEKNLKF